jgi:hypothetical protein
MPALPVADFYPSEPANGGILWSEASMARTEEQKRTRAPIAVRFGDEDYQIPLLLVNPQRKWRRKLVKQLGTILENFEITTTDSKVLSRGLIAALVHFPEKLAELVFAYASDLDQGKILKQASEEQIAIAFGSIFEVAFPFIGELGLVMQILQAEKRG